MIDFKKFFFFSWKLAFLLLSLTFLSANSTTFAAEVPPPTDLSAKAGDDKVSLTWNNPDINIVSVNIYFKKEGALEYRQKQIFDDSEKEVIKTPIVNDVTYQFKVSVNKDSAEENHPESDKVGPVVATPKSSIESGRETIQDFSLDPGDGFVKLAWNNPTVDGFEWCTVHIYSNSYSSHIEKKMLIKVRNIDGLVLKMESNTILKSLPMMKIV